MTRTFIIVNVALGAVLVVIVLVLIAFTIIIVIMWRGKKAMSNSTTLSHNSTQLSDRFVSYRVEL